MRWVWYTEERTTYQWVKAVIINMSWPTSLDMLLDSGMNRADQIGTPTSKSFLKTSKRVSILYSLMLSPSVWQPDAVMCGRVHSDLPSYPKLVISTSLLPVRYVLTAFLLFFQVIFITSDAVFRRMRNMCFLATAKNFSVRKYSTSQRKCVWRRSLMRRK